MVCSSDRELTGENLASVERGDRRTQVRLRRSGLTDRTALHTPSKTNPLKELSPQFRLSTLHKIGSPQCIAGADRTRIRHPYGV